MERIYGGHLCYGPPIESGFYYDMFLDDLYVYIFFLFYSSNGCWHLYNTLINLEKETSSVDLSGVKLLPSFKKIQSYFVFGPPNAKRK